MAKERQWAVIVDGVVINKVVSGSDLHATHGGDAWVEVTDMDPMPSQGWTYADGVFTAPEEE